MHARLATDGDERVHVQNRRRFVWQHGRLEAIRKIISWYEADSGVVDAAHAYVTNHAVNITWESGRERNI